MVDVKMYPQVYTEIEPLWYKILCVFSMLVNIILMLISIALLGLGVWFQITANDYINYGDHGTWSIAIAGLVFLFLAMAALTTLLLVSYGVLLLLRVGKMGTMIEHNWNQTLNQHVKDKIMKTHKCCGLDDIKEVHDCNYLKPCGPKLVKYGQRAYRLFGWSYSIATAVLILSLIFTKFLSREPKVVMIDGQFRLKKKKKKNDSDSESVSDSGSKKEETESKTESA